MITGRDAGSEARVLDDLAKGKEGDTLQDTLLRGLVKGVAVIVKVLVTIRGNQVAIMKKMNIELRAPKDRNIDNAKDEKEKK